VGRVKQENQAEEKKSNAFRQKELPQQIWRTSPCFRAANCWLSVEGDCGADSPHRVVIAFYWLKGLRIVLARQARETRPKWSFREIGARGHGKCRSLWRVVGRHRRQSSLGSLSFDHASLKADHSVIAELHSD